MYNIFRLTGRYEEAAFLRELFDEPAPMLYQVWSLIRTVDDASNPDSRDLDGGRAGAGGRADPGGGAGAGGGGRDRDRALLLRLRDELTHQRSDESLDAEARRRGPR